MVSVGRFAIAKDEVEEASGGKFLGRPSDPQGEFRGQEGGDSCGQISAPGVTVFINRLCCVV